MKLFNLLSLVFLFAGCTGPMLTAPAISGSYETLLHPGMRVPKTVICEGDCPPTLTESEALWDDASGTSWFSGGEQVVTLTEGDLPPDVVEADPEACGVSQYEAAKPEDGCRITIQERCWSNMDLVAHELGHCLGFDHSTNPVSVMYPVAGWMITPELVDLLTN